MITTYTPEPVMVIIDVQACPRGAAPQAPQALTPSARPLRRVQPQELGLPTSAYTVVEEISAVRVRA